MSTQHTDTIEYSPVCVIYSGYSLNEISQLLEEFPRNRDGKTYKFSNLKIVKSFKDGRRVVTNRTIVLLNHNLFDCIVEKGLHLPKKDHRRQEFDFRVLPFEVSPRALPHEGHTKDFFIRVPHQVEMSQRELEHFVHTKLAPLVEYGLLQERDYHIKIPMKNNNRNESRVGKSFFIEFSPNVTAKTAALIKAVIDDTYWDESESIYFNCYWSHEPTPRKPKQDKSKHQKSVEPWEALPNERNNV